jgi:prepilin-type N-terminal cleavage/methylation domain-containing protein
MSRRFTLIELLVVVSSNRLCCAPGDFNAIRNRFTLIELLVVIAIISVLAALLLPALQTAKQQSYRVQCIANMKQHLIAAHNFADDSDDAFPNVNTGSYGALGVTGPSANSGATQAQADAAIKANAVATYSKDYMASPWTWHSGTKRMNVPGVWRCPGLSFGVKMSHAWMPGHANGLYEMGEQSWGGSIVGIGSFLGMNFCNHTTGNGNVYTVNLKRTRLHFPEAEVLFLDTLMVRGNVSSYVGGQQWTTPHGQGKPSGINQAFADGSAGWYRWGELTYVYRPAYPWDRQVTTPYYAPKNARFNRGGYPPGLGGYFAAPMNYYGIASTPHGGSCTPN